ncbi:unnamed protein product [Linum tenue]|uniref:Uncharacterized protein n=1 Tax=Linum tenue TaxID=586396 RepID=A0AAV0H5P1_9ROSI|nr:unnamed protein product [Linum tenue]
MLAMTFHPYLLTSSISSNKMRLPRSATKGNTYEMLLASLFSVMLCLQLQN